MIQDILTDVCARYPAVNACVIDRDAITYSELLKRAQEAAKRLKTQGSGLVMLRGGHSVDEIVTVVACLLAGRAYVPVGGGMPENRAAEIERMCEAGVPGDTAYVIFTSGSTGTPKGVPVSYGNLENFAGWISGLAPFDGYRGARVLNQAALSFDLSVADLYYALCNGHTWVARSSGLWGGEGGAAGLFASEQIDVAVMTPSAMKMCLLEDDFCRERIPDLKCAYFCGERLEKKTVVKLWERFPGLEIVNAYGPTEATSAVCAVRITPEMLEAEDELPVGRIAGAAVDISVVDGEIVLAGKSVFGGYLGQDAAVSSYRTGDCGRIRDGLLYCDGRLDSQIKYKGYRIELYDIENNMNRIPGVRESAVVALKNEVGTVKTIKGFCVAEGDGIDGIYVKNALREALPEYMVPKTIRIVDSLPVNANGKIDRRALELL